MKISVDPDIVCHELTQNFLDSVTALSCEAKKRITCLQSVLETIKMEIQNMEEEQLPAIGKYKK